MAPTSNPCQICAGIFAASAFDNLDSSSVCRWCAHRIFLMGEISQERAERIKLEGKVNILHAKLESLVSGTVSLPSINAVNLPVEQNNENSSNSRKPPVAFQVIQRGARPTRVKPFLPITTSNRFSVLGFEDESEPETILVGDSICRGQLEEFCGRNYRRRKRFCCPGGRVEDLTNSVDSFTEGIEETSRIVVHVGTNNVLGSRSEELLEKYRALIQILKAKTNNILFAGILPRIDARSDFYGKAFYINNCLGSLCQQENIG